MASITLAKVSKEFPSRSRKESSAVAIKEITFTVEDGEFFTLLGPSGCGKSTLLNIVAGLDAPTKGDVYFDNRQVTFFDPSERDVAMVFQSYALYPHLSVFENIAFPLRVRKVNRTEIKKKVEETAKTLSIFDLLKRKPRDLSGGQRQRVALARALVRQPEAFLMDEPLSNLDASLRISMRQELQRIHKEWKTSILYVTHDQEEALALSDRIAVIDRGELQQCGTPIELYDRPRNLFVARFLGSPVMNIFNPQLFANLSNVPEILQGEKSEELVCGLRPRDIKIYKNPKAKSERFILPGQVVSAQSLGSETLVELAVGKTFLNVHIQGRQEVTPGDEVVLVANWNKLHVFYRSTGKRIDM